jgi:TolA-binding protein
MLESNSLLKPIITRCLSWALLAVVTCVSASCVTIGRHDELELRVAELELSKKDADHAAKRDEARFQNLAQQIKDATSGLQKQAASIAANGDARGGDVRKLLGRVEEAEHLAARMAAEMEVVKKFLDARFGLTVTPLPPDLPEDPQALFDYGNKRLAAGQFDLARAVLRHFVRHHEAHELTDAAELKIGESYHKQRRWQQALQAYGGLYEKYAGRSDKKTPAIVAKALLLAGQALDDGGNCVKAKDMYRLLIRTKKKSPEAATAKARIKKKCK